jgi:hypothetical protein
MKKTFLILFFFSMPLFLMSQETGKQKEIGLVFSNLDNFGLTFKTGNYKSLWRFNTLFIYGNNTNTTEDSSVNKQNNMGFGFKLGKEYRKPIVKNLELRFGADLSFNYSYSEYDEDDKTIDDHDRSNKQTTYSPGINLVFGLNYILNENFVIGSELLPNFSYNTGTSVDKYYYTNNGNEVKHDISGFSYGLSNSSVLLSLTYRF